ncbi:unnamed protein product [Dracunculus medinensis]|uniref:RadC domain-containing protein n=1 Tax=Dracunculus medinensis TaxID=318479 RepID=A0A0N4UC94_DRAME|nr:unnamed protein product [Dracunculus medinensis]
MNTDNDSQIKEISSPDGARRGQPGRDSRATFTQTHAMCKQYYRFALNERTTNAARLFINEVNSSDVSILQIANLQFGRLVGISDIRFSL